MVTLRPRAPKEEPPTKSSKASAKRKTKKPSPKAAPSKDATTAASANSDTTTILQDFLQRVPDTSKHDDITWLHNEIRRRAPLLVPELQGQATLAYGGFAYRTKSGCSGRWSRISITVNTTGVSLMVSAQSSRREEESSYLLEDYDAKSFGKGVAKGKSCLRFKSLATVNREAIGDLCAAAAVAKESALAVS